MSGLVRAERLFRARRRAVRRQTAKPLLIAAIVTTVVGLGAWVALYSPLLQLRSVRVEGLSLDGTSRLTAQQVIAAARAPLGRSLFEVSPGTIRARVQRLPAVARATVSRSWPDRLVVRVVERTAVAAVGTASGIALVDADGVAFATAEAMPPTLVDLQVGGPLPGAGEADARAGLRVWSQLPGALRRQVTWVRAASPDAVTFGLARGATVVWGSAADPADKLAVLAALLRHPAHTYDVSTPAIAVTR